MNKLTSLYLRNQLAIILGIALAALFDSLTLGVLIAIIVQWQVKRYERREHER